MKPSSVRNPITRWLEAATIYNLAWGLAVIVAPAAVFGLAGVTVVEPLAWRVVGMMVLVYSPAYAWASAHPERAKPVVAIGFLGKVGGVVGVAIATMAGGAAPGLVWIVLFNDLIWLPAFARYLLFGPAPHRRFVGSRIRADLWSPYLPIFASGPDQPTETFTNQLLRRPDEDFVSVADGRMTRVWWRPGWLTPLFVMLGSLGILVPRQGADVPARLRVRPAFDDIGRPYQVCDREFDFARQHAFVTVKKFEPDLGVITEAVGPRGIIVVAWETQLRSWRLLTFRTIGVGVQFGARRAWLDNSIWQWVFGRTVFVQLADRLVKDLILIRMTVRHPWLGPVFGYEGKFQISRKSKSR